MVAFFFSLSRSNHSVLRISYCSFLGLLSSFSPFSSLHSLQDLLVRSLIYLITLTCSFPANPAHSLPSSPLTSSSSSSTLYLAVGKPCPKRPVHLRTNCHCKQLQSSILSPTPATNLLHQHHHRAIRQHAITVSSTPTAEPDALLTTSLLRDGWTGSTPRSEPLPAPVTPSTTSPLHALRQFHFAARILRCVESCR